MKEEKGLRNKSSIGTERESSLHRALKFRYAGPEGYTEVSAGDYVCDGLTEEGELIEVQTGSFGPLKDKARKLAERSPLRIVYPVILNKYIDLYDEEGTLLHSRKSPRHGSIWDLFKALLYAPELPGTPNLRIELAPVDIREQRVQDGSGSRRRKGVRIADKSSLAFYPSLLLAGPEDYRCFLPFKINEEFTSGDLAEKVKINAVLAGKALYVLLKMELIERIGKRGRFWLYRKVIRRKNRKTAKTPSKDIKRAGQNPALSKELLINDRQGRVFYQPSGISSGSRSFSAKRSVTARRSSK